jgi:hypothetical protein
MFEDLQHNAEPEAVDLLMEVLTNLLLVRLFWVLRFKKLVLREWIKAGLSSYFHVLVLIY